jgi:hypothetical protein
MSRKCCAESFFLESVPLMHAEKLLIVSKKTRVSDRYDSESINVATQFQVQLTQRQRI